MTTSRRNVLISSVALGASALTRTSFAQDIWPGGGSDIFVRVLEPRLKEKLGQSLFIENHPGAGGMTAAAVANSARPDGYTFFISNVATNGIGVSLYRKPTFDPKKDLPPVGRIATFSNALAIRADKGINSVADLTAYLRANPKAGFFGSAGSGTSSHLSSLLYGQRIGVELTHVPYKGPAANLNGLLGGDVLFSIDNLPLYTQHVKAGTLKLLAVTKAIRSPSNPDVPTMQESGIRDFDITSWYGISAATGTPQAIVDRMGQEIVSALADPDVVAKIRAIGADPAPLGPQAYAAFIQSEIQKWAPLVKASNAMVD